MKFTINPLDLHHYEIFKLCPIQAKLFGRSFEKKYMGYATVSLNGENVDVYCENKQMKNFSEIIGEHTYNYYTRQIQENINV